MPTLTVLHVLLAHNTTCRIATALKNSSFFHD